MKFSTQSLTATSLLWLLACALLLSACAEKPKLPRLAPDASILAFGDSLTHGTGASSEQSYPTVLAQLTGRRVINAGIPGETTAEGLARLPRVLEETRPGLVILCLGGNDFLRHVNIAHTRRNLEQMIQLVRSENIPLVLLAVPEIGLFSGSHPVYSELAKKYKLPVENEVLADILHDKALKSDPIHPNAEGYRQLAQAVAKLLRASSAI